MRLSSLMHLIPVLTLILPYVLSNIGKQLDSDGEKSKNNDDGYITFNRGDFRLKKYNDIWDRAQHLLSLGDQRKLYKEMLTLDRLALAAKHNLELGKKRSADEMRAADKKLYKLLQNLKLERLAEKVLKTMDLSVEAINSKTPRKHVEMYGDELIDKDDKLFKLWNDAKSVGFSEQELTELKEEFVHYAKKQENHERLTNDLLDEEHNSIFSHLHDDAKSDKVQVSDLHLKLKHRDKLLNENFAKLVEKVGDEKKRSADGQLKNAKAKQIWEKAVKSGSFNDEQLEDLLHELKHFDNRLEKLKHIEEDFAETKFKMNKLGKLDQKFDEYSKLEQKFNDYEKRMRKLEMYLVQKVEL